MTMKKSDYKIHKIYGIANFVCTACGKHKRYDKRTMAQTDELVTCKICLKVIDSEVP